MPRFFYLLGRTAQVLGLLAMPAAIWAGEMRHSEREAIGIFLVSLTVFAAGFFIARLASRG